MCAAGAAVRSRSAHGPQSRRQKSEGEEECSRAECPAVAARARYTESSASRGCDCSSPRDLCTVAQTAGSFRSSLSGRSSTPLSSDAIAASQQHRHQATQRTRKTPEEISSPIECRSTRWIGQHSYLVRAQARISGHIAWPFFFGRETRTRCRSKRLT
jgi:hypothetical protein